MEVAFAQTERLLLRRDEPLSKRKGECTMRLCLQRSVPFFLVLLSTQAAEAAQESVGTVAPLVGLSFVVWFVVSVLLAINHPSISTTTLVCWFLLFFPVSALLFNGNIEVYLVIWYAYIALSLCKVLLMERWIEPERRRFLLEWKGITFLAVTLVAMAARFSRLGGVGELLHGYTAPEFLHLFGVVSCAVFAFTFLAYYCLTMKHS